MPGRTRLCACVFYAFIPEESVFRTYSLIFAGKIGRVRFAWLPEAHSCHLLARIRDARLGHQDGPLTVSTKAKLLYAKTSIFSSVMEISLDPDTRARSISAHSCASTFEKPNVATVTNRDVNDLRWSTKEQSSIVEVHVFSEDDEILYAAAFPNLRISRR